MRAFLAVPLLAALTLAGCTSVPAPATAVDVAGIIAPYKADWIKAATTQSECAEAWVFDRSTGPDCYVLADTVDTTTATALQELDELGPPEGRESDFAALTSSLEAASALKIRAVCGTEAVPNTKVGACGDLIVDRVTALGLLNRELTKWP
ncbi:hypothetical protein GCM10022239_03210 [Leifsonia bigeumensis]|uniref:Uncharacterized protein n=1 Tax=Leifsonella bigeumensis TaxID=433643 RepID=A0ABP7F495_9MICO